MKKICAKILILIMLVNIILPLSVFAEGAVKLYNHGEETYLLHSIEMCEGYYYISVADLGELELYTTASETLSIRSYDDNLVIYPGMSVVKVNGTELLFPNAMRVVGGREYVSLRLIAMAFSGIYEITDNSIYLWINTGGACTARGVISLPNGEIAPAGGIEISVFYGNKLVEKKKSNGGSGSGEIVGLETGYSGVQKPITVNGAVEYSMHKIAESSVTIPEGENSVEYVLGIPYMTSGCVLGYEVDTEKYKEVYTEIVNRNFEIRNFTIYSKSVELSGTVTLPEAAENDVCFTVYAENYNEAMYSYSGVIAAGADSATYSMHVGQYGDYSMSLIFSGRKYKRMLKEEVITADETAVTDVDFAAEKSDVLSGTLKIPNDTAIGEDTEIKVTIQSRKSPYYYIDSEEVTIPAGSTNGNFTLYDDMGYGDVICFYELQTESDDLFDFGHYRKSGTTVINDNAEKISFRENTRQSIEISLIKSKSAEVTLNLPEGYTADKNICGDVYLTNAYKAENDGNMAVVGGSGATEDDGDDVYFPSNNITKADEDIILPGNTPKDDWEVVLPDNITKVDWDIVIPDEIERDNITAYKADNKVTIVPAGGGSGGGGSIARPSIPVSKTVLIKKGESRAIKKFKIPDNADFKYNVVLHGINEDGNRFYHMTYYKGGGEMTVLKDRAKALTSEADNIELTLMKQYEINGKIDTDIDCDGGRVYAIYQSGAEIGTDVKNAVFKVSAESDFYNNFKMFLPEELDKYVFRFDIFDKTVYYSAKGLAEEASNAETVTINGNTDIEIAYKGRTAEQPLVITHTDSKGEEAEGFNGYIFLENVTDYVQESEDLYMASYDAGGKLLYVKILPTLRIKPHSTGTGFLISNYMDKNAAYVKVFAWSDKMKPLALSRNISEQ